MFGSYSCAYAVRRYKVCSDDPAEAWFLFVARCREMDFKIKELKIARVRLVIESHGTSSQNMRLLTAVVKNSHDFICHTVHSDPHLNGMNESQNYGYLHIQVKSV